MSGNITPTDPAPVTAADREAAFRIARFFLGNSNALPEELLNGTGHHFLLDELRDHRIAASAEVERLREALSEVEHAESIQIARLVAKRALALLGGEQ